VNYNQEPHGLGGRDNIPFAVEDQANTHFSAAAHEAIDELFLPQISQFSEQLGMPSTS
jgi:hypothetical protein